MRPYRPRRDGVLLSNTWGAGNRDSRICQEFLHHTLKNLWDLSHLIDPVRFRFEFNNPDTNHGNCRWSPLGHGEYRPDALFATVMEASPLAWMELSDVSEKSVAEIAALVKVWERERERVSVKSCFCDENQGLARIAGR